MTASVDIDGVFGALADPTRRRLLQLLGDRRPSSATALAAEMTVSRQAVVQHLAVLERSRLVSGRRSGREVLFTVRPEPLLATASWMTHLAETWDERLRLLKQMAEEGTGPDQARTAAPTPPGPPGPDVAGGAPRAGAAERPHEKERR